MAGDPDRQPMRRKDWIVAILIAGVLVLIILAIFRMGLSLLYGAPSPS